MAATRTRIELYSQLGAELVPAVLIEDIGKPQLKRHREWQPHLDQYRGAAGDGDWDWAEKIQEVRSTGRTAYLFSVEARGRLQGLMIASADEHSNLNAGERLIYVDYLASAPWNRRGFMPGSSDAPEPLSKVGVAMILRAVYLSREQGFDGRLGLHSLSASENFYLRSCHFTFIGEEIALYRDPGFNFLELPEPSADFLIRRQERGSGD